MLGRLEIVESAIADQANDQAVVPPLIFIWIFCTILYENLHFYLQEVFLSDNNQGTSMSEIVGRCCVMHVKDYFKCKPEVRFQYFANYEMDKNLLKYFEM